MKSFYRLFFVFAFVCFLLSAAAFASSLQGSGNGNTAPADGGSYVLKSDGEAVCVYADTACTEPLGVLNINTSELPAEDRGLLECGLLIETEEQLLSVIEDYTG